MGHPPGALMICKCGARTFRAHLLKIIHRVMGAHVYTGFYWAPTDDA